MKREILSYFEPWTKESVIFAKKSYEKDLYILGKEVPACREMKEYDFRQ